MKRRLSLLLFILLAATLPLAGQGYDAPEVVLSTEKANIAGKVYFLHKVLPKQTVFSICKAYGVTGDELAAANPDLKDGLKAGAILFVPVSEAMAKAEAERKPQDQNVQQEENTQELPEEETDNEDGKVMERVIEHRVRWYESIGSIARKYGLSTAEILSYNGLSSSDSIRGRTLLIPVMRNTYSGMDPEGSAEVRNGAPSAVTDTSESPEDPMTPVRKARWFSSREPLHLALILPFNAGGKASANFLNFYSGALMAIQEQKEKGAHLVVNVYDLAQGADAILKDPRFQECELVIGPVEAATLDPFLRSSDRNGTILVSPLDHKADSLVNDHPCFFQVPPSTRVQLENMVGSLRRNHGPVVLVSNRSSDGESAFAQQIEDLLQTAGLPYRKASLADLSSLAATGTHNAPAQVIIGSEDKNFATEAIRTLNTMRKKNIPLEVWCTNRVRNLETSDPDALFNISLHTSVPYFADYSNADDQDFVLRYRALFYAEPDEFAFQGHDVLTYFIASLMQQGTAFIDHADLHPMQLLHCNFRFVRDHGKSGWRNRATRNLVYDKNDFAILLSK